MLQSSFYYLLELLQSNNIDVDDIKNGLWLGGAPSYAFSGVQEATKLVNFRRELELVTKKIEAGDKVTPLHQLP